MQDLPENTITVAFLLHLGIKSGIQKDACKEEGKWMQSKAETNSEKWKEILNFEVTNFMLPYQEYRLWALSPPLSKKFHTKFDRDNILLFLQIMQICETG